VTAQAFPQNSPLSGSIRYEFKYEDVLANSLSSTSRFHTPSIFLLKKGFVYSPNLFTYAISTSLTASYQNTLSPLTSSNGTQIHWNEYDVNLYFLQTSPVKFQLSTREYTDDMKYEYSTLSFNSRSRNHQDIATFEVDRVRYLPRLNFSYIRNKAWSLEGPSFEQRSDQYNFSAYSRNGTEGYASVVGSLSDFHERSIGFSERILTIQFDGSQNLAEGHTVTVGSEFDKYDNYSSLTGGASYSALLSPWLGINTGLNGQNASSRNYLYYTVGVSQGVRLTLDEHFRLGARGSVNRGASTSQLLLRPTRVPNDRWEGLFDINHVRAFGNVSVTNGLVFTYGQFDYLESFSYYSLVFANSANTTVGQFAINGTYNFSYHKNNSTLAWQSWENTALLSVNGMLPAMIQTQTLADFRSVEYSGFAVTASDLSSMKFSETLGKQFAHLIPFTLRVRGSVQYFYRGVSGRTYSFGASFQSPRFFINNLTASYIYSRDYDPFYRILTINHTATFNYRWRLLTFQLGFMERSEFSRIRQVRFTVERTL
jgi:hypothetical protein